MRVKKGASLPCPTEERPEVAETSVAHPAASWASPRNRCGRMTDADDAALPCELLEATEGRRATLSADTSCCDVDRSSSPATPARPGAAPCSSMNAFMSKSSPRRRWALRKLRSRLRERSAPVGVCCAVFGAQALVPPTPTSLRARSSSSATVAASEAMDARARRCGRDDDDVGRGGLPSPSCRLPDSAIEAAWPMLFSSSAQQGQHGV